MRTLNSFLSSGVLFLGLSNFVHANGQACKTIFNPFNKQDTLQKSSPSRYVYEQSAGSCYAYAASDMMSIFASSSSGNKIDPLVQALYYGLADHKPEKYVYGGVPGSAGGRSESFFTSEIAQKASLLLNRSSASISKYFLSDVNQRYFCGRRKMGSQGEGEYLHSSGSNLIHPSDFVRAMVVAMWIKNPLPTNVLPSHLKQEIVSYMLDSRVKSPSIIGIESTLLSDFKNANNYKLESAIDFCKTEIASEVLPSLRDDFCAQLTQSSAQFIYTFVSSQNASIEERASFLFEFLDGVAQSEGHGDEEDVFESYARVAQRATRNLSGFQSHPYSVYEKILNTPADTRIQDTYFGGSYHVLTYPKNGLNPFPRTVSGARSNFFFPSVLPVEKQNGSDDLVNFDVNVDFSEPLYAALLANSLKYRCIPTRLSQGGKLGFYQRRGNIDPGSGYQINPKATKEAITGFLAKGYGVTVYYRPDLLGIVQKGDRDSHHASVIVAQKSFPVLDRNRKPTGENRCFYLVKNSWGGSSVNHVTNAKVKKAMVLVGSNNKAEEKKGYFWLSEETLGKEVYEVLAIDNRPWR